MVFLCLRIVFRIHLTQRLSALPQRFNKSFLILAWFDSSKEMILKSPYFLGAQTLCQATWHFLVMTPLPDQRKVLHMASTFLIKKLGRGMHCNQLLGIAKRTLLNNWNLPRKTYHLGTLMLHSIHNCFKDEALIHI